MIQRWLSSMLCCLALPLAATEFPPLILTEGVGVNIHFTRGHERDLDLIAAAGLKYIRMDFSWGGTERERGDYQWSDYEELTRNLEKRGLSAIYILDYSNALYEQDNASPRKPESVAAFAKWAAAAAEHFKGSPIIWEIWNEPNIFFWKPQPNVDDYIRLAKATCHAIREKDAGAKIVAPASSEFPWEFFEKMFQAGLLEQLDAVSVHPYRTYSRTPETVADDYLKLRAMIERYAPEHKKAMPILSGEWGYATHDKGIALETQAAFIVRQQLFNLLSRVPISIWYDWKNDGPKPDDAEHNFGTVYQDLRPKPAYLALQTLTKELAGFRIARRIETADPEAFVLLLINPEGRQKIAAWSRVAEREVAIETGLERAELVTIVDGQGTPRARVLTNGNLHLALASSPVYVTFKEPSHVLKAAAAWEIKEPYARSIIAGEKRGLELQLAVENRFPQAIKAEVALAGPGLSVLKSEKIPVGRSALFNLSCAIQRRDLDQAPITVSVEMWGGDGELIGSSTERLLFHIANPLKLVASPVEGGVLVTVENPAHAKFTGFLQSGNQKQSVNLTTDAPSSVLRNKPSSQESNYTAGPFQLTTRDGKMVAELPRTRYQVLDLGSFSAGLDGDEKISASAKIEQVPAPGENAPWPKAFALDYQFEEGWRFVRCDTETKLRFDTRPHQIGAWVYGDNSGNLLRLRVRDAEGQTFQPSGPALNWTGWRWITFDLEHLDEAGHWGGANDGIVRGTLTLETPLLLDGSRRKTSGRIYFAGITAIW